MALHLHYRLKADAVFFAHLCNTKHANGFGLECKDDLPWTFIGDLSPLWRPCMLPWPTP